MVQSRMNIVALALTLTRCSDPGGETTESTGASSGSSSGVTTTNTTTATTSTTSTSEPTTTSMSPTTSTTTSTTTGDTSSTTSVEGPSSSTASGSTTGVDPGACALDPPEGPGANGYKFEACTVLGPPLRAEDFIGALWGFAVDDKGGFILNLEDQAPIYLTDTPDPGCALEQSAFPPILDDWGGVEVAGDGTAYFMAETSGLKDIVWTGPKSGECPDLGGWSADASFAVTDDGRIFSNSSFEDFPILFDTNKCESGPYMKIPGNINAALLYDGDLIVLNPANLQRWTLDGVLKWTSTEKHSFAFTLARCGADVCVLQQGSAENAKVFSAVDGALLATPSYADLFGIDEYHEAVIDSRPDGTKVAAAFSVAHPDPACAANDMFNILVYRRTP